MNIRGSASYAGTSVVAGIAAYASYEHMRELALAAGQTTSIATVLPLSVDGLVIVASAALVDGRERKTSAWFAFALGVTASVIANVLAAGPSLTDRCVSAWPSVALLVTIEVIARGGRRQPAMARTDPVTVPEPLPVVAAAVVPVATAELVTVTKPAAGRTVTRAKRAAATADRVAQAAAKMPGAGVTELAHRLKLSESTVRRHLTAAANRQVVAS